MQVQVVFFLKNTKVFFWCVVRRALFCMSTILPNVSPEMLLQQQLWSLTVNKTRVNEAGILAAAVRQNEACAAPDLQQLSVPHSPKALLGRYHTRIPATFLVSETDHSLACV